MLCHAGFKLQTISSVVQFSPYVAVPTPFLTFFSNNGRWQTFNTTQQDWTFANDLAFQTEAVIHCRRGRRTT
jgi:hypothetical protein